MTRQIHELSINQVIEHTVAVPMQLSRKRLLIEAR